MRNGRGTGRVLLVAASAAGLVAMTAGAGATPRAPEPAEQVHQVAEPGTERGAVRFSGTGQRSVCHDGAQWLRLRFVALRLRGGDSVRLTGSAGGSVTLTARNWPGRAFHTRALPGDCVTVTPRLGSPESRYTVDAYQAGGRPLAESAVTLAAVGDICGSACNQTDDVVSGMDPQAVITAGDNAYDSGTLSEFRNNYDPHWGKFNDRVHPSPGNHEYRTRDAAGYRDYYRGNGVEIGGDSKYYYSFDVGEWHVVSLNSNIGTGSGSAQVEWLRRDLAATTKPCTMAYWHHPRFSSGAHGDNRGMASLYQALTDHKAEVVVAGHDHSYERFAPAMADGTKDTQNGLRQFVIGTGGRGLYSGTQRSAGPSEVFDNDTFGVGRFVLSGTGYDFEFEPVAGRTFTDSISGSCR